MIDAQEAVIGVVLWAVLVTMQGLWLVQGLWPHRLRARLRNGRVLLWVSVVIHLAMLVSLDGDWFDPLGMEPAGGGPGHDFGAVYYAGKAVADGGSPYDRSYGHTTAFRYLPFPALVFAFTLSLLRFKVAFYLWVLIGELALLGFFRWMWRAHPDHPRRRWAMGVVLISYPLYGQFHSGQFDLAMGLLMALCAICILEHRQRMAMWAWILSVLTKLYSFALVPSLLLRGQIRWVLSCLAFGLVLSLPWMLRFTDGSLGLAEGIEHFTRNVRQQDYLWLGHTGMRHLVYLTLRRGFELLTEPATAQQLARAGSLVFAGTVVLLTLLKTWRRRHVWSLADDLLLWVLCFFLAAGDVWVFSYVALMPLLVLCAMGERSWPVQLGLGLIALPTAWIFIAIAHPEASGHEYAMSPVVEILFRVPHGLGTALVFAWALRRRSPLLHAGWVDPARANRYS